MVILIGAVLSTAVFVLVTVISSIYRNVANRQRSVNVGREIRDTFARVDAVFREARHAMDAVTGRRERRPFGDWQDLL
jgi:hypothetical protein